MDYLNLMESSQPQLEIGKKMDFKDVADNREAFYQESEKFSGNEIEITFKLDYNGDLNGKEFSDTFKEGQDFEYVKYKLSQVLGVNPEQIDLYFSDKPIIPVYSICDIGIKANEVITVKIKAA